ncbi:MAG: hypothetical protein JJE52_08685 [Acidimicrobiia bacterium]|nr:hypothetical protein [Acidimicrobiia bacterium]
MIEMTVSEDAGAVPDFGIVQHRVNRRRRRSAVGRGMGGLAVAVLIVAAGVQIRGGNDAGVTVSSRSGVIEVTAVDLSDRVVEVVLPDRIGVGYTVVGQSAEISVAGRGWRVDAFRGGDTAGAPTTCDGPGQTIVAGTIGAWTVEFSGDDMTFEACTLLQAELEQFEATDDGVRYVGSNTLGPDVNGPHVVAVTDTARLSVFHRPCHLSGTPTAGGLVAERVDDPARGGTLTVLCDDAAEVELWIDAPDWPSDTEIEMVTVVLR